MEIRQLRFIVAAAEEKSFTRAANLCFTSRQNVSRAVKDLENELRITIFTREGNAILPTTMGEIVIEQARRIIDQVDSLRALCDGRPIESVHMRTAISLNVFAGALSEIGAIVDEFAADHRVLELSCKECYEYVCAKKVDVAIAMSMERDFPDCLSLKLASSAPYLIVSSDSPLASKRHCTLADLKDMSFVLMTDPEFQYKPMFELMSDFGFNESSYSIVPSTSTMIHIIKRVHNTGAIVTDTFLADTPRGTKVLPILDFRLRWNTYILYWSNPSMYRAIDSLSQRVRAMLE